MKELVGFLALLVIVIVMLGISVVKPIEQQSVNLGPTLTYANPNSAARDMENLAYLAGETATAQFQEELSTIVAQRQVISRATQEALVQNNQNTLSALAIATNQMGSTLAAIEVHSQKVLLIEQETIAIERKAQAERDFADLQSNNLYRQRTDIVSTILLISGAIFAAVFGACLSVSLGLTIYRVATIYTYQLQRRATFAPIALHGEGYYWNDGELLCAGPTISTLPPSIDVNQSERLRRVVNQGLQKTIDPERLLINQERKKRDQLRMLAHKVLVHGYITNSFAARHLAEVAGFKNKEAAAKFTAWLYERGSLEYKNPANLTSGYCLRTDKEGREMLPEDIVKGVSWLTSFAIPQWDTPNIIEPDWGQYKAMQDVSIHD